MDENGLNKYGYGCSCLTGGTPIYSCDLCNYIDHIPHNHIAIPLMFLAEQNQLPMETVDDVLYLKEILKKSINLN